MQRVKGELYRVGGSSPLQGHGPPNEACLSSSLHCSHQQRCPPALPCTAELQSALEDGKLALKAREERIQELEAAAAAAGESASEAQVRFGLL